MWRVLVRLHHRPRLPVRLSTPWRHPSLLYRFWSVCHPKILSMLGTSENHLRQSLNNMLDAGVLTCAGGASSMRKRPRLSGQPLCNFLQTVFSTAGTSNKQLLLFPRHWSSESFRILHRSSESYTILHWSSESYTILHCGSESYTILQPYMPVCLILQDHSSDFLHSFLRPYYYYGMCGKRTHTNNVQGREVHLKSIQRLLDLITMSLSSNHKPIKLQEPDIQFYILFSVS